eukprot:scpid7044/ scgid21740/ Ras guanine nucleotide exchange factor Y; RasGEF domain-containing protein Y
MSFSGVLRDGYRRRLESKDRSNSFVGSSSLVSSEMALGGNSSSGAFPEKYWSTTSSVLEMASSYSRMMLDHLSMHELRLDDDDDEDPGEDGATDSSCSRSGSDAESVVYVRHQGRNGTAGWRGSLALGDGDDDDWEDCSDTVTENEDEDDDEEEEEEDAEYGDKLRSLLRDEPGLNARIALLTADRLNAEQSASNIEHMLEQHEHPLDISAISPVNGDDHSEPDEHAYADDLSLGDPNKSPEKSAGLWPESEHAAATATPAERRPRRWTEGANVFGRDRPRSQSQRSRVAAVAKAGLFRRDDVLRRSETVRRHMAVSRSSPTPAMLPVQPGDADGRHNQATIGQDVAVGSAPAAVTTRPAKTSGSGEQKRTSAILPEWGRSVLRRKSKAKFDDAVENDDVPGDLLNTSPPSKSSGFVARKSADKLQVRDASKRQSYLCATDPQMLPEKTHKKPFKALKQLFTPRPSSPLAKPVTPKKKAAAQAASSSSGDMEAAVASSPSPSQSSPRRQGQAKAKTVQLDRFMQRSLHGEPVQHSTPSRHDADQSPSTLVARETPPIPDVRSVSAPPIRNVPSADTPPIVDVPSADTPPIADVSPPLSSPRGKQWVSAQHYFVQTPRRPLRQRSSTSSSDDDDVRKGASRITQTSQKSPSVDDGREIANHSDTPRTPLPAVVRNETTPPGEAASGELMRAERRVPITPQSSHSNLYRTRLAAGNRGRQSATSMPSSTSGSPTPGDDLAATGTVDQGNEQQPSRHRRLLPATPDTAPYTPPCGLQRISLSQTSSPNASANNSLDVPSTRPSAARKSWSSRPGSPMWLEEPRTERSNSLPDRPSIRIAQQDAVLRQSASPQRRKLAGRRNRLAAHAAMDSAKSSPAVATSPTQLAATKSKSLTLPTFHKNKTTTLTRDKKAKKGKGAAVELLYQQCPVSEEPLCVEPAPAPILPLFRDILQLDVRHIAEELTLIDSELLRQIRAEELENCAWMASDREVRAPNIMRMVEAFNRVALMTTTKVLTPKTAVERAGVIAFFVKVAEECLKLHNFNSLKAILAGLQCTPMFRLTKTWKEVSNNKSKRFAELSEVMTEKNNYIIYRKCMDDAMESPPCIPFLGVFLTQVVQVDALSKLQHKLRNRSMRRSTRRASTRMSRRNIKRPSSRQHHHLTHSSSAHGSSRDLRQASRHSGPNTPSRLTPSLAGSHRDLRRRSNSRSSVRRTRHVHSASAISHKKLLHKGLHVSDRPRQRTPIYVSADNDTFDVDAPASDGQLDGDASPWYEDPSDLAPGTRRSAATVNHADSALLSAGTPPQNESSSPASAQGSRGHSSSVSTAGTSTPVPSSLDASAARSASPTRACSPNPTMPVPLPRTSRTGPMDLGENGEDDDDDEWEDMSDSIIISPDFDTPILPSTMPLSPVLMPTILATEETDNTATDAPDSPGKDEHASIMAAEVPSEEPGRSTREERGRARENPREQGDGGGGGHNGMKERTESGDQSSETSFQSPTCEDSAYCTGSERTQHSRNSSMDSPFRHRTVALTTTTTITVTDGNTTSELMATSATAQQATSDVATETEKPRYQERAIDVTSSLLDLSVQQPTRRRSAGLDKFTVSRRSSSNSNSGVTSPTSGRGFLYSREASGDESRSTSAQQAPLERTASRESTASVASGMNKHQLREQTGSSSGGDKKKSHRRNSSLQLFTKSDSSSSTSVPPSPHFAHDTKHMSLSRQRSSYLSVALAKPASDDSSAETSPAKRAAGEDDGNAQAESTSEAIHQLQVPVPRRQLERRKTDSSIVVNPHVGAAAGNVQRSDADRPAALTTANILSRANAPRLRERIIAILTPKSRSKAPPVQANKHHRRPSLKPKDNKVAPTCFSSLESELERYKVAAGEYHHCSRPWVRYTINNAAFNTEEENYKLSWEREAKTGAKTSWLTKLNVARKAG